MFVKACPATRDMLRRERASCASMPRVALRYSAAATPVHTMTVASTGARRQDSAKSTNTLPVASRIARRPRSRDTFLRSAASCLLLLQDS